MTENFATNDLVLGFTEETGFDAFLAEAFEFDFSNEDDYQEIETLLKEDNSHEDSFYDHTFKKEFKAKRRERRKRNAYHDIRLENRAEDALANYSKRLEEAEHNSDGMSLSFIMLTILLKSVSS